MERFIGLDVHAASTTCAVIDARGKRVRVDVVETNGQALIHSDLHYANVMARAGNWVAIDPKPLSGDPHYEIAPMLWNRLHELSGRMRDGISQRFFTLVDAAALDEERARDWVVVRMLHNALWRLQDPPGARRLIATDDWLTICVSVAKAVQE